MSVQWALPMLDSLLPSDLMARLQSTAVDPYYVYPETGNHMPFYHGGTGELLKNIPLVKMLRVSRRKFRALCAEGIDIQYDKVFDSASFSADGTNVTAHFSDGFTATGTVLVGADGARSRVRSSLLGAAGEADIIPFGGLNFHVSYGDAQKALFVRKYLTPIQAIGVHPDGYWLWISVQDVPHPDDPASWTFQLQTTWRTDASSTAAVTSMAAHKARAQTFAEPFRSANVWVPDSTPLHENKISVWMPVAMDTRDGRACVVGDAAHPMPFQRGQGLNHGIADAVALTRELLDYSQGRKTRLEGISAYQEEMVKRAGEEVRVGMENTEMLHDWDKVTKSPFFVRGGDKNQ
ncbi:FAD/NAD(P)-binding domain-containing protein [Rhizodiscina lignyota]|uniref:FAD/NAD(P)-binding domain-containing protein n=1 Tax=Rhizodiscina lignyota TaxID=1504668 RepID=A0A9P4ITT2_9PEZI|nr:FAD/NAD(P)-binding domain-containing protein [Rhizodiscina lignyota]